MSTKVTSGEGVDRIQAFPPSSDMSHSLDRAAGRESLGMRVTSVGVPCHLAQCVVFFSEHEGGGEIPRRLCRLAAREGQRTIENNGEHVMASGHTLPD